MLFGGKLEKEVFWKAPAVPLNRFVQAESGNAVDSGKIGIKDDTMATNRADELMDIGLD
jgi:hypothetical protein